MMDISYGVSPLCQNLVRVTSGHSDRPESVVGRKLDLRR